MEQQIAPTLWLPPGTCLLNHVPTMQLPTPPSATSYHQITSQLLKQQVIGHSVPGANLLQNQTLMQHPHLLQPAQSFIRVPHLDNLLLPTNGKQIIEIPCASSNLHFDHSVPLPLGSTLLPSDVPTVHRHMMSSKIMKRKRISPSAKRRSRLRLIAFLEAKKKQQTELSPSDDINTLQLPDHEKHECSTESEGSPLFNSETPSPNSISS